MSFQEREIGPEGGVPRFGCQINWAKDTCMPTIVRTSNRYSFFMSICKIYLAIVLGYDIVFERLDIISFVVLDSKQFSVIAVFIDLRMP